jgi:hypothetical protein
MRAKREDQTMRKSSRLPTRFPEGTKYVLESHGGEIRRYVEFPDGRRVTLSKRKAVNCLCAEADEVSIVPPALAEAKRGRRSTRVLETA